MSEMGTAKLGAGRKSLAADWHDVWTTGVEATAGWWINEAWGLAAGRQIHYSPRRPSANIRAGSGAAERRSCV